MARLCPWKGHCVLLGILCVCFWAQVVSQYVSPQGQPAERFLMASPAIGWYLATCPLASWQSSFISARSLWEGPAELRCDVSTGLGVSPPVMNSLFYWPLHLLPGWNHHRQCVVFLTHFKSSDLCSDRAVLVWGAAACWTLKALSGSLAFGLTCVSEFLRCELLV